VRLTGIIIRAKVDGRWGDYDMGDPKLSDEQILDWLDKQISESGQSFCKKLTLVLLSREDWR